MQINNNKPKIINVSQFAKKKRLHYPTFLALVHFFNPPVLKNSGSSTIYKYDDLKKLLEYSQKAKEDYHKAI